MSPRIWPGALCVVRGCVTTTEMNGRFVVAVRTLADGELLDGLPVVRVRRREGALWIVRSAVSGSLLPERTESNRLTFWPERALKERVLFPITPPPGTDCTDDRAPCEVELVGV